MSDWFYIMAIEWQDYRGWNRRSSSGIGKMLEGQTETQMYNFLYEQVCRQWGAPASGTAVVFYYLRPNQVATTGSAS